jgi:8-oxo-dGTP pyrophosphatase MutT (NUDIX family)
VSCGTLIVNPYGEILLCHVTGYHQLWDLPKGCKEPHETPLEAAKRELQEETSLVLDDCPFEDLGEFHYKTDKWLHLYKVPVPLTRINVEELTCISHFRHYRTGLMCPEMDGYRWAGREDVAQLCGPDLAKLLLSLDW